MKLINNLKNLPILSTLIPIVVLFFVVYFILIPAIKKDSLLVQQIKNTKLGLGVIQSPIQEYGSLKENINSKNAQLAGIKMKLFWERDISKFLNEFTRSASDLQIEFISLRPEAMPEEESNKPDKKEPQELKKLTPVPIAVVFRSSYNDIINFLQRIEKGEKFIRIDSLSIESEPANIHKHLTKMKLSIFIDKGRQD